MTSNVESNYVTRQILPVQQKLRENFRHKPEMTAAYWTTGAVDLCSHLKMRHNGDIAQLVFAQLRDCRPRQEYVEEHIATREAQSSSSEAPAISTCPPTCMHGLLCSRIPVSIIDHLLP